MREMNFRLTCDHSCACCSPLIPLLNKNLRLTHLFALVYTQNAFFVMLMNICRGHYNLHFVRLPLVLLVSRYSTMFCTRSSNFFSLYNSFVHISSIVGLIETLRRYILISHISNIQWMSNSLNNASSVSTTTLLLPEAL